MSNKYLIEAKLKIIMAKGTATNSDKVFAIIIELSKLQRKLSSKNIVDTVTSSLNISESLCRKIMSELLKLGVIKKEQSFYIID